MKLNYKKTPLAKELESSHAMNGIDLNFTPERKTKYSCGYDLKACIKEKIEIPPGGVVKIGSGIHIDIIHLEHRGAMLATEEDGATVGGWLTPRSSIDGLRLENTNGIIDTDYQGELIFKLRNSSGETKHISPGDRFMQLLFTMFLLPKMDEVEEFTSTTERGEGGFGSTG